MLAKFTRQKSLQTLPGKLDLLFLIGADLRAGGRSVFIAYSLRQRRYGHKSGRVTGRRMPVEAAEGAGADAKQVCLA